MKISHSECKPVASLVVALLLLVLSAGPRSFRSVASEDRIVVTWPLETG